MTSPDSELPAPPLVLPFRRAGRDGTVTVDLGSNDDPAALGCPEFARGYPVCRATIAPPARGYNDAIGWIQLVASTVEHGSSPGGGAFAMDPFEPLGEPANPFCFFGFAPVLFDAPHRDSLPDMDWIANSFLAELSAENQAAAILGFSWGFSIRDGEIAIDAAAPLAGDEAWDRHAPVLTAAHPDWTFVPGLGTGPGRSVG